MTPEEEIARGEKARQVLEDPLVRGALDDIKQSIIQQWSKCPVKDTDLKERLWGLFNAADKFEEILKTHIETGKMARIQVEQKGFLSRFK